VAFAQTFRYNELETAYLVCSVFILLAGMSFQSGILVRGKVTYWMVTYLVALAVVGSAVTFILVLGVEVYRTVRAARPQKLLVRAGSEGGSSPHVFSNSLFFARSPTLRKGIGYAVAKLLYEGCCLRCAPH
jgi:hypothetical protein